MEDLEASQLVDIKSAEAVERHYRRGRRAPSGTGDRWSSLRAWTSMEQQHEQRGSREIGMEFRVRGDREIKDKGGYNLGIVE